VKVERDAGIAEWFDAAEAMGISNSPAFRTQPSSVARLSSTPQSRSSIALCRYSG
jgi:hypothetical protein